MQKRPLKADEVQEAESPLRASRRNQPGHTLILALGLISDF